MENRSYYSLYLMAFLIATSIFIFLFVLAESISYLNYQGIQSNNNLVNGYIEDLNGYLNSSTCSNYILIQASERLDLIGSRISILESRFGKNDPRVLEQKNYYSELEFRHYLIVLKSNELCKTNYTSFFFFYSNSEENARSSDHIGYILNTLKVENPDRVMVYSFDFDLNSSLINNLKSMYNITSPLSVYSEGQVIHPTDLDSLQRLL